MIYVLSGGQTGATLTVTSSGAGTITVSNATLGKSYSKSVTAGGSVVFKGLKTGTWTIRLTDGSKTSTKTITITNDYSTNIAYFSATISITYPAKSTCVVKNSGGQTVASNTNTGTSTKTWTATVNATGTYTVTATATDGSGKSKSQSVSITADGQSKSVTLSYQLILIAPTTAAIATGYALENKSVTTNSTYGNYIQFGRGSTAGAGGYINPAIDLTNYNTLRLKACLTGSASSGTSYGTIGVYKTLPTNSAPNPVAGIYMGYGYDDDTHFGLSKAGEFTVDISELSGEYYFSGFNNGWPPAVFWAIFE